MLIFLILCYAWGSLLPGIIIGRHWFGQDIRARDNPGASGSWRQYGPMAGIAVAMLDLAKGAFVVLAGREFALSSAQLTLAVGGVVAGHNWPLWFGFSGGGGLATVAGALLLLAPRYTLLGIAASVLVALLYWASPLRGRLPLAALPAGASLGLPLYLGITWWAQETTAFSSTLVAGSLIAIRGLQMLAAGKKDGTR